MIQLTKSSRFELRVSPSEKEAWAQAAGGERKVSEWLRGLANESSGPTDPVSQLANLRVVPLGVSPTRQCSRWMHHRKGVFCGACSKVV